uniref:Secreted protein n=1 Tax=Arundo donax TaxID=35708 RepID=A0A0A8XNE9_ARUDO
MLHAFNAKCQLIRLLLFFSRFITGLTLGQNNTSKGFRIKGAVCWGLESQATRTSGRWCSRPRLASGDEKIAIKMCCWLFSCVG